jgi:hypothetical protein
MSNVDKASLTRKSRINFRDKQFLVLSRFLDNRPVGAPQCAALAEGELPIRNPIRGILAAAAAALDGQLTALEQ